MERVQVIIDNIEYKKMSSHLQRSVKMEQILYLAYGSNLNLSQMSLRCPGAKPLGSGELPGWRLAFRGAERGYYLTLLPAPGQSVPVGIWAVTPEDVEKLDEYEGYPEFYYKTELDVDYLDSASGERRSDQALVYIMRDGYGPGAPTGEYYKGCLEGFGSFGLDTAPLEAAYREVTP